MGWFSSAVTLSGAVSSLTSTTEICKEKEETLFSDFNETVARLKAFDLEASTPQSQADASPSLSQIKKRPSDVK
ncbi:MAG: hypothetical protein ACRC6D_08605 [Aeromonas sp.]